MSTVFASQVDGWDDDYDSHFRYRNATLNDGDNEGYSGNPSHYIDIDETPEAYFAQKEYERLESENFRKNADTVKSCITDGIVLPPSNLIGKILDKLKTIAHA